MEEPVGQLPAELPVVAALRTVSIFGADQGGAYREHYAKIAEALGDDVRTRLGESTRQWTTSGVPGVRILTGNAGTGKTAVAEAFCQANGSDLPESDEVTEVVPRPVRSKGSLWIIGPRPASGGATTRAHRGSRWRPGAGLRQRRRHA